MNLNNQILADEEEAYAQAYAETDSQAGGGADQGRPSPTYEAAGSIGTKLAYEFKLAERDRRLTEERWIKDIRQFKGQYDPDVLAKMDKDRSRSFLRKTRVKVVTVNARMEDLLFPSNSEKSFTCDPTPKPTMAGEQKQLIVAALTQGLGRAPTKQELDDALLVAAKTAAGEMSKTIDDQLVECQYKDVAKKVIHSGNLYGTGILKAPLVEKKIRTRFVPEEYIENAAEAKPEKKIRWKMVTESYVVPFVEYVPIWRWYPDMAATQLKDCRYVWERHLMTKAGMASLASRKSFNGKAIKNYVEGNPRGAGTIRYPDIELRIIGERIEVKNRDDGFYEVLERWGWLDADDLKQAGVEIPPERMHETFFANVWILPNGEVIKAVLQPLNGTTWPYHIYYFDKDETSIFGEGLATIMRDDQEMLNASVRMILDNAALTAGPQLEANVNLLAAGEKPTSHFPFKVWPRKGLGEDAKAPALRVIEMPNSIRELLMIKELFDDNADETTAIPRYLYGENPTGGAAGTMGGLSMLLGASNIVVKTLIGNYDDGVTSSFVRALYYWNMQWNPDPKIKGDFDLKANGVASLVAKEMRAKQLDDFSQLAANPLDAPYVKRIDLLRQRAEAHELSNVVMTDDEIAAQQNSQMAQMQAQIAQLTQQLQIALLQGQVAKVNAEGRRIDAQATAANVGAAYSAMQAGGVAVSSPMIAPAADEILRSAGWKDATPDQPMGNLPPGQQPPAQQVPPPVGPQAGEQVGMQQGIETMEPTDGAQ